MITVPHNLIIFDLETTDISLGDIEIVEIGAVKLNTALEIVDQWNTLVQPSALEKFTPTCASITGIHPVMLQTAPRWQDVWRKFAEFSNFDHGRLATWGSYFDYGVLRNQYSRLNLGFPHRGDGMDIQSIAYFVMSWYGMRPDGWSLQKVCDRLDIPIPPTKSFHRALNDALFTHDVLVAVSALLTGT